MNLVIPPLFFYLIGVALMIGGAVRAATLGRRDSRGEINEDSPERAKARRRHRTFGLIWVAMGLFLIASTAGVLHMRH
jgi:hypothetical protein